MGKVSHPVTNYTLARQIITDQKIFQLRNLIKYREYV